MPKEFFEIDAYGNYPIVNPYFDYVIDAKFIYRGCSVSEIDRLNEINTSKIKIDDRTLVFEERQTGNKLIYLPIKMRFYISPNIHLNGDTLFISSQYTHIFSKNELQIFFRENFKPESRNGIIFLEEDTLSKILQFQDQNIKFQKIKDYLYHTYLYVGEQYIVDAFNHKRNAYLELYDVKTRLLLHTFEVEGYKISIMNVGTNNRYLYAKMEDTGQFLYFWNLKTFELQNFNLNDYPETIYSDGEVFYIVTNNLMVFSAELQKIDEIPFERKDVGMLYKDNCLYFCYLHQIMIFTNVGSRSNPKLEFKSIIKGPRYFVSALRYL